MPLGRWIYGVPPLFPGNGTETRWGLLEPPYGISTACREWYETLTFLVRKLGGRAALLDKSVFARALEEFRYVHGKGLRDKCIWNNEKGIFGRDGNIGAGAKTNAVGIAISQVGDLLVSGAGMFFALLRGNLEKSSAQMRRWGG